MPIYIVSVTSGKEEVVADLISNEAKKNKLEIYSILQIPGIKGYIFVEALNSLEIQRVLVGLRYARKVIPQEISMDELNKYFEEEKVELNPGDIVEILAGAFKGTRGKIINIDDKKEEASIELIDVPVPLQLSIPLNNLKIVEKSK
ncbi:transcription elongation factor Spt5 [Nanobdella aerobiophila]|uniref:Transcription elongation factor Spt5 n=1 Tax=Nanobdella aerobiophila TaxID=2586965 RepID=A0A915WRX8_9ARCH|nr:transcription elongation factor Spt5 [Nanobdella aerobiophila]BBL45311.1 transcription elongation factor Spt5 [Nanobdella aerobiophila]